MRLYPGGLAKLTDRRLASPIGLLVTAFNTLEKNGLCYCNLQKIVMLLPETFMP
jgi:hypothetical protein